MWYLAIVGAGQNFLSVQGAPLNRGVKCLQPPLLESPDVMRVFILQGVFSAKQQQLRGCCASRVKNYYTSVAHGMV